MVESSESVEQKLERWCRTLSSRIAEDPSGWTEPGDQLAIENTIAAGIAVLANEPAPTPSLEVSERPILLKDILITADLVRRSLAS